MFTVRTHRATGLGENIVGIGIPRVRQGAVALDATGLIALGLDTAYRDDRTEHDVAIDHPLAFAVDRLDLRHTISPLRRRTVGPQGVRLT
jgi:hypothetical protein